MKLFVELSDKTQHCLSMRDDRPLRCTVKWRRGPGYMSIRASLEVVPMNRSHDAICQEPPKTQPPDRSKESAGMTIYNPVHSFSLLTPHNPNQHVASTPPNNTTSHPYDPRAEQYRRATHVGGVR